MRRPTLDARKTSKIISEFLDLDVEIEKALSFIHYYQLLSEWNTKLNLVKIKDWDDFLHMHILDSISPLKWGLIKGHERLCDLGSGGGLPGIPIKIMLPTVKVVLIDSRRKKILALKNMIESLKLGNTVAVWGRAEDMTENSRAAFDIITARAVGREEEVIQMATPLLREAGSCIIYATEGMRKSIEAKKTVKPKLYEYEFRGLNQRRVLHVFSI